ncbi:MAG: hypothetical protein HQM09_10110 [Candidatus Riflebacteria bacterium]|nr:hypothetical protein [Candidatus Riflebacteria bacterium]
MLKIADYRLYQRLVPRTSAFINVSLKALAAGETPFDRSTADNVTDVTDNASVSENSSAEDTSSGAGSTFGASTGVAAQTFPNVSGQSEASGQSTTSVSGAKQTVKGSGSGGQPLKLDPKALAVVRELQRTDEEVRAHEAAHMAVGGSYVQGAASYTFTTGPDGSRYATGGEVQIDTSPVPDDPKATEQKMQTVRRAALAPAQPSGQDLAVAASAAQAEEVARTEETAKTRSEAESKTPEFQRG